MSAPIPREHDWFVDWPLERLARSKHRNANGWTDTPSEAEVAVSIAISLKRIADALEQQVQP